MSEEEIRQLKASTETDKRVAAAVMGWTPDGIYGDFFLDGRGFAWDTHPNAAGHRRFHPSCDLNACHEMESEIERQGRHLRNTYMMHLYRLLPTTDSAHTAEWNIAHAPALTRCKAALLAAVEVNAMRGDAGITK